MTRLMLFIAVSITMPAYFFGYLFQIASDWFMFGIEAAKLATDEELERTEK